MVVLLLAIIVFQGVEEHNYETEERNTELLVEQEAAYEKALSKEHPYVPFAVREALKIPLPSGVNLGSWLALEDYFFAGAHNSIEVATPGFRDDASKIAACLPPLHVGSTTGPKWHSETDLFRNLMDPEVTRGGSVKHAIEVFAAHRTSFVDMETDFQRMAALGITTVRVPMNWCWTDSDPRSTDLSSLTDEELLEEFACEDPFFTDGGDLKSETTTGPILWPAIPKALIEDLLKSCAKAGIKASLDVHTHPGGTSIGTFSGVWPNWPRFWTHGGDGVDSTHSERGGKGFGIGHRLIGDLIAWMEDLSVRDPLAFSGLRGISPMNEPAHLSSNFEVDDSDNFLPPLPPDLAADFRGQLGGDFPDGTHLRVLYWFQRTVDLFRNSKLPALGIELQANIIESIFPPFDPREEEDGTLKIEAIGKWWCASFPEDADAEAETGPVMTSAEERSSWAVLDVHHYHAWSTICSGTVDGQDSAYVCGDVDHRNEVLDRCSEWVTLYRETMNRVCDDVGDKTKTQKAPKPKTKPRHAPAKLMSAEFSASSHHSVRRSCNDIGGLKASYVRQVKSAEVAGVELFYWSYQMPYGGTFRRAWSFRELMYNLGVLDRPDEPQFDCDSEMAYDPELPH
eukprot:jgi/Psemu1/318933/estExt_fgenesh1_pm.C_1430003